MREDIYRVVRNLVDLDNSKQLTPDQAEEFTSFIVDTVVEEANRKIQQALEMFNFEVYDQPYFEDVSSTVVGEDLAELITTMLESM